MSSSSDCIPAVTPSSSGASNAAKRRDRRCMAKGILDELHLIKGQSLALQSAVETLTLQVGHLSQFLAPGAQPAGWPQAAMWNHPFLAWCSMSPAVPPQDMGPPGLCTRHHEETRRQQNGHYDGDEATSTTANGMSTDPDVLTAKEYYIGEFCVEKSTQWQPLAAPVFADFAVQTEQLDMVIGKEEAIQTDEHQWATIASQTEFARVEAFRQETLADAAKIDAVNGAWEEIAECARLPLQVGDAESQAEQNERIVEEQEKVPPWAPWLVATIAKMRINDGENEESTGMSSA